MAGEINGAELVARAIKQLGISCVFGLTGFPVTAVAESLINVGVKFIGFRNEQAASYAAAAYGYLTGKPGCCLVVGGPGVVHAMSGVYNASGNCFPLLVLAGSAETNLVNKDTFQELDAVSLLTPHTKKAMRWTKQDDAIDVITRAYRLAWYGKPGPAFVDLPADLLQGKTASAQTGKSITIGQPARPLAEPARVQQIAQRLKHARAPLILIGKGAAYARAEMNLRRLIDATKLPFLPSPMGKGVVPDFHSCNVNSARSVALKQADVVLVLAARLNWIFHFGGPPKYNADACIIQVDIDGNQLGHNSGSSELSVLADVGVFADQLVEQLGQWQYSENTAYWQSIRKEQERHESMQARLSQIQIQPLKIENAFDVMRMTFARLCPPDTGGICLISEGARTMDTSRLWFEHSHPRLRLDAGSHGTMGIGLGYAIAAWEAYNGKGSTLGRKKIICIMGDSAFGFSMAEFETMARFGMDVLIFIMNNSGVYHGADGKQEWLKQQEATKNGRHKDGLRSWDLGFETRYELWAEVLGSVPRT